MRAPRHRHPAPTTISSAPPIDGVGRGLRAGRTVASLAGRAVPLPRSPAPARGVERVHAIVGADELYRRNGLQHLPFNDACSRSPSTAFVERARRGGADAAPPRPASAGGRPATAVAERTNASTTGLLAPRPASTGTATWSHDSGSAAALLPPARRPRHRRSAPCSDADVGSVRDRTRRRAPLHGRLARHRVGGRRHPPRPTRTAVYISCGTWSLVGAELPEPLDHLRGRPALAGFTNEGGVDGRTRFLTNVMGLWLLSESDPHLGEGEASASGPRRPPRCRPPTHSPDVPVVRRRRRPAPALPPTTCCGPDRGRCSSDARLRACRPPSRSAGAQHPRRASPRPTPSAVQRYRASDRPDDPHRASRRAAERSNELLCRLTADAVGPARRRGAGRGDRDRQPPRAGAGAHGLVAGDLEALRTVVTLRSFEPHRFEPRASEITRRG